MMGVATYEFELGETVYLKTDIDQYPRLVTGVTLRPRNAEIYYLSLGTSETEHYGIEISRERDILKKVTN